MDIKSEWNKVTDGNSSLSLIWLSDMYRRQAFGNTDTAEISSMVSLTREIAILTTHMRHNDSAFDHDILDDINDRLLAIADLLENFNYQTVVLPFGGLGENVIADAIKARLSQTPSLVNVFEFMESKYNLDLKHKGAIDPNVETILDQCVLGLAEIERDLKYSWNSEIKKYDNLPLDFGVA